ncbi:hypothetical protein ACE6H2_010210 [Prunus campanulata]
MIGGDWVKGLVTWRKGFRRTIPPTSTGEGAQSNTRPRWLHSYHCKFTISPSDSPENGGKSNAAASAAASSDAIVFAWVSVSVSSMRSPT